MTLQMRDNENIELGEYKNVVSLVRGAVLELDILSLALKISVENILRIQSLIETHPEMDDKEIAELYINEQE